jgi:hypothetical protein
MSSYGMLRRSVALLAAVITSVTLVGTAEAQPLESDFRVVWEQDAGRNNAEAGIHWRFVREGRNDAWALPIESAMSPSLRTSVERSVRVKDLNVSCRSTLCEVVVSFDVSPDQLATSRAYTALMREADRKADELGLQALGGAFFYDGALFASFYLREMPQDRP